MKRGRGRNRGRGCTNRSGQEEEDFQGCQNTNDIPFNPFLDPNNISSIQFTQNIPQSYMSPNVDMNLFHNQRPSTTQPI